MFRQLQHSGFGRSGRLCSLQKAKPSKKDYRKYIIKTVTGPDDYASMKEVVRRRYSRAIEEGSPLPDLIITDGGKGQMEVVREVIEDELHLDIPIAGLAKDRKHRTSELLYGFPPLTIGVKQSTPLFHLLENIQNEVHRFAITFHRDKRSKSQVASALDNIKGIGEKRKTALLKTFKSVSRIKQASLEEIAAVVGEAAAKISKKTSQNKRDFLPLHTSIARICRPHNCQAKRSAMFPPTIVGGHNTGKRQAFSNNK